MEMSREPRWNTLERVTKYLVSIFDLVCCPLRNDTSCIDGVNLLNKSVQMSSNKVATCWRNQQVSVLDSVVSLIWFQFVWFRIEMTNLGLRFLECCGSEGTSLANIGIKIERYQIKIPWTINNIRWNIHMGVEVSHGEVSIYYYVWIAVTPFVYLLARKSLFLENCLAFRWCINIYLVSGNTVCVSTCQVEFLFFENLSCLCVSTCQVEFVFMRTCLAFRWGINVVSGNTMCVSTCQVEFVLWRTVSLYSTTAE